MGDGAPRVGLVLGAGGVAGGAFHAGVLAAVAEVTGWDPRRATYVVGTSAGSIVGATLRSGLSAADLLARAENRPLSAEGARMMQRAGPPRRPPAMRPAAPRAPDLASLAATVAKAATRPFNARPWAVFAGMMPAGKVSTDLIADSISLFASDRWPDQPLWLCAVRQNDGRRVVFGRDTTAPLPRASAASCAIPGFFEPVTIDGTAYIDGGVHSPTNADVLLDVRRELDLILVSSPMSVSGRGLRLAVDQATRRWSRTLLDAESVRLRRKGPPVVAFQPTVEDIAVMGPNAMDPARRVAVARQAHESTLRRLDRADTRARLAPLFG
jgi:NTE family protein